MNDETNPRAIGRITARLMPLLLLSYIVCYLDRVNVGMAALQMKPDLGLSEEAFGFGAGLFFIGYFFFEVPSNLILERVGARIWIARIMVSWGIVSSCMMFVHSAAMFYVMRFILGAAEAGFYPGIILYLTYWFPRRERARAVAYLTMGSALAVSLGGPIGGALLLLKGTAGLAGWQWLFLIEAFPAVLLGFVVLLWLPDRPSTAQWLPESEREWLRICLEREGDGCSHLEVRALARVLTSRSVMMFALLYFLMVAGMYGVSFWLPLMLKAKGLTEMPIGLLNGLIYFIAAASAFLWAGHSDRTGERRIHCAIPALVGAVGLLMTITNPPLVLVVIAFAMAAAGALGAVPAFWSGVTQALSPLECAAGIAAVNSIGNLSGFLAPYCVGKLKAVTGGYGASMLLLALSLLGAAILGMKLLQNNPAGASERETSVGTRVR